MIRPVGIGMRGVHELTADEFFHQDPGWTYVWRLGRTFFRRACGCLKVAADGFVKLLQMAVLPYITISIITSLGTLRYDQAKTLGLRAGSVLGGLWCVALLFTFLFPMIVNDLETQLHDIARTERVDRGDNFRLMSANLRPARRGQHQNRQPLSGKILLVAQVLVSSNEEIRLSRLQEGAVVKLRPAHS
jgi:hypothetical protein